MACCARDYAGLLIEDLHTRAEHFVTRFTERSVDLVSKQDYNFQVLLLLLAVMLGIVGIAALGALIMFLTAFM